MNRTARLRISKGGQLSLPAEIRHRWGVAELLLEDRGAELVLRHMPDDPVAAARGALAPPREPIDRLRAESRRDEQNAERRKTKE